MGLIIVGGIFMENSEIEIKKIGLKDDLQGKTNPRFVSFKVQPCQPRIPPKIMEFNKK
jgi:hypothetical protein